MNEVHQNGTCSVVPIVMRICRVVIALGLLMTVSLAETPATTGSLQGVVFTRNADGSRAVVPGARVSLCGAITNETQAGASGGYVFTNLPPGSHTVTAQAPGLTSTQTIIHVQGSSTELPLEMKVEASSTVVVVSASAAENTDSAAAPVLDVHLGFPYSTINQSREFVGPRNGLRFPRFASADVQVLREIHLPFPGDHRARGGGAFNIFNRFDSRDVQNDVDSYRFNQFFNGPGQIFRGKFVLEF